MSQAANTIDTSGTTDTASAQRRPNGYGLYLVVSGVIGLVASLALAIEKIEQLRNPLANLSCDISLLVQCSANLDSPRARCSASPTPISGSSASPSC